MHSNNNLTDRQLRELNEKLTDLTLKVNRNNIQTIDLIKINEVDVQALQSNVSKTFGLLSEHFDIANPWDIILSENTKVEDVNYVSNNKINEEVSVEENKKE